MGLFSLLLLAQGVPRKSAPAMANTGACHGFTGSGAGVNKVERWFLTKMSYTSIVYYQQRINPEQKKEMQVEAIKLA